MNIIHVAQLILTGTMKDLPQDLRQNIIKIVLSAQKKTVIFENGMANCPICSVFGLNGIVKVRSTQGEIRYCECLSCTATFAAVGEKFQKKNEQSDLLKIAPIKEKMRKRKK